MAKLVMKGFLQQMGVDFTEIFTLVVKIQMIGLVLGIATAWGLELEQVNVKIIFLHGDIEE